MQRVAAQPGASLPKRKSELGLSSQETGQLGNLPLKAQELLQAPFSSKDPVQRCEYWYSGRANRLDTYMFILAGTPLRHCRRRHPAGAGREHCRQCPLEPDLPPSSSGTRRRFVICPRTSHTWEG